MVPASSSRPTGSTRDGRGGAVATADGTSTEATGTAFGGILMVGFTITELVITVSGETRWERDDPDG